MKPRMAYRRRLRNSHLVVPSQAKDSQLTYEELIESLIWHYDQFQILWGCALGLDPPDWQAREQISGDLSELEPKLLHVGVLL